MRPSLVCLLLLLAGCASPRREPDAEARAYERGYRQAVKEQYWIIQNQQRTASSASNPNTP
ncbi:MAG: hypothetical protein ACOZE5_09775 [Verrucomicrobiota bacterium]|jgi:hypothetical protein